ncbi:hypothetical protein HDU77_000469 [Chytriomyces hyalinus]|nr:hypothetical protein HDU77_000469 [Chytriomyces hyalinus]
MNVSDTGPSSTTATATAATSATSTAAATSYWGNGRFTTDGVVYLKHQRDEGVTSRAEHAAQRKQISSNANWFNNNSKPAGGERRANADKQPAVPETNLQSKSSRATLERSAQPQLHSDTPLSELTVASAKAVFHNHIETGFQIFKREECNVFQDGPLEQDSNLEGRTRRQAIMGLASKATSAKWRNLNDEQRAVYKAKASIANAKPLELVRDLDIDQKDKLFSKSLVQMGKILEVLEALGWSFMFAAINEETHATFKEVKGTAATVADIKYQKAKMGLEAHLTASLMLIKSYPAVAKSVTKNKAGLQRRVEQLALHSLNECLDKAGLKQFSTFPWSQVESKQVLQRSFHFLDWPANIPLKRTLTIENCEIIIRLFEQRLIQGSIGADQREGGESGGRDLDSRNGRDSREISDCSLDIENVQPDSVTGSEAGFRDMSFLDFLNNVTG